MANEPNAWSAAAGCLSHLLALSRILQPCALHPCECHSCKPRQIAFHGCPCSLCEFPCSLAASQGLRPMRRPLDLAPSLKAVLRRRRSPASVLGNNWQPQCLIWHCLAMGGERRHANPYKVSFIAALGSHPDASSNPYMKGTLSTLTGDAVHRTFMENDVHSPGTHCAQVTVATF